MANRFDVSNSKQSFLGEDVVYSGEVRLKDCTPDGRGMAKFTNGDEFRGTFSKGDPVFGTYTFSNGSYCQIQYKYNIIRTRYSRNYVTSGGYGYRTFKYQTYDEFSNGYYRGEEKNGMRNGIGTYVWNSGSSYTGGWLDNEKHGIGKITYENGDYYWGVWEKGKEVCVLNSYRKETQEKQEYSYDYNNDYDYNFDSDDNEPEEKPRPFDENFEEAIRAYNRGDYMVAKRELDSIYYNTDYSSSYSMIDEWGDEHDFDDFREMVKEECEAEESEQ